MKISLFPNLVSKSFAELDAGDLVLHKKLPSPILIVGGHAQGDLHMLALGGETALFDFPVYPGKDHCLALQDDWRFNIRPDFASTKSALNAERGKIVIGGGRRMFRTVAASNSIEDEVLIDLDALKLCDSSADSARGPACNWSIEILNSPAGWVPMSSVIGETGEGS